MNSESHWVQRPWVAIAVLALVYVAAGYALMSSYFYAWRASLPDTPPASWDHLQTLSALFGWGGIGMLLLAILASVILVFKHKTRRRNLAD